MTSDGTRTFGYTSDNQLATVTGGSWATNFRLDYDALGRLAWMQDEWPTPVYFDYAGDELIIEKDGGGNIARRYVHGAGVDEPLVWYEGSGTSDRRYLHADERGSIVAVSDSAGSVIGVNRYDEYGKPQGPSGAGTLLGRFGYTGQSWLPEVGLYYYKARMYDPKLQVFMQTDPIGYGDGMNMYAYVGRDPVNFTDPTGTQIVGGGIIVCGNCWKNSDSGIGGFSNIGGVGTGTVYFDQDPRQLARDARKEKEKEEEEIVVTAQRVATCGIFCQIGHIWRSWTGGGFTGGGGSTGGGGATGSWDCGCFEAGTLVSTPSGLRRIEEIGIGDLVLAVKPDTGEIAAKPVTDLIRARPRPLYALRLLDAGGEAETFHATDDHPWKVEGKGWVETANLKPGDRIDTASGADMVVTTLELTSRMEQTYNLTVADWHTFMVGEDRAVVHNIDCKQAMREFRTNRNFRDFVHREKQRGKMGGDGAGRRNLNINEKQIAELFEDWIAAGRPSRK